MQKMIFLCFFLLCSSWGEVNAGPLTAQDRKKWLQSELNLSSEQSQKIKKILKSYEKRMAEQLKELERVKNDFRVHFRTTKKGDNYNHLLLRKFEEVQKARHEKHETRFLMAIELRDVLNTKQISKLNSLKEFEKTK